ncbi:MAG: hypothetical protein R3B48_11170 [Kofleriaceae bacterium]
MATKKTPTKATNATKAAPKASKSQRAAARKAAAKKPAGPKAVLAARHGSKESLVGTILSALVRADENREVVQSRLLKASNAQLLRLAGVVETVNKKYGGRDKLIDAISKATKSAKDKDYLAKLATYSLPRLLDLASAKQRAAR